MGFWKGLWENFQKRFMEEEELELDADIASMEEWDWETLVKDRHLLKLSDPYERQKFIRSCLDQMQDSSKEVESLTAEYNMVTAYLTDMEELEALPESEMQEVQHTARILLLREEENRSFEEKKNRISETEFRQMAQLEDTMPKAYQDVKEAENYRDKIRADLSKLEGEKQGYLYQKEELRRTIANIRGMVLICCMAVAACMVMLLILQFGFAMDTTLGYILTAGCGAVALTFLYVNYLENTKEFRRAESGFNKIILLKNTVNIRYVNNTNLLEYLYLKYKITSAKELEKKWDLYQQEKADRERRLQNREELDFYQRELLKILRRYRLHDPTIWAHRPEALLDRKEMVEVRHSYVIRRQKLRAQMDYNRKLASEAQKELKLMAENYPDYTKEILDSLKHYDIGE